MLRSGCRDAGGRLWSIQTVDENGKRFLKDSHKAGTMHVLEPTGKGTLGALKPPIHGTILIAEGYATAARLYEATDRATVAAFDSGNLKAVAEAVRAKFPDRQIVIAADNDHANKLGNVGMVKAEEAAKAVGAVLVAPRFTAEEMARNLTDFDDLGKARGNQAVKQAVNSALAHSREGTTIWPSALTLTPWPLTPLPRLHGWPSVRADHQLQERRCRGEVGGHRGRSDRRGARPDPGRSRQCPCRPRNRTAGAGGQGRQDRLWRLGESAR